jgi:protein-S-isoprenylcysteine O-methyltransferase Ste14
VDALELKVPPPLIALLVGALMWLASYGVPHLSVHIPGRLPLALAFVVLGVAVAVAGVLAFRTARTTVNPLRPEATSALVTAGIYRISRNPMYLGMLLALVGWAVHLQHALAFLPVPLFVLYMNRFQIGPEERVLSGRFGAQFSAYMQSVRRWL